MVSMCPNTGKCQLLGLNLKIIVFTKTLNLKNHTIFVNVRINLLVLLLRGKIIGIMET
jgi:hypothetical protein